MNDRVTDTDSFTKGKFVYINNLRHDYGTRKDFRRQNDEIRIGSRLDSKI